MSWHFLHFLLFPTFSSLSLSLSLSLQLIRRHVVNDSDNDLTSRLPVDTYINPFCLLFTNPAVRLPRKVSLDPAVVADDVFCVCVVCVCVPGTLREWGEKRDSGDGEVRGVSGVDRGWVSGGGAFHFLD